MNAGVSSEPGTDDLVGDGTVDVSVIVPTRNRAAGLNQLLHHLVALEVDGFSYEILIVDNGSTDHTREVVERAARTSPRVRYLREPRVGASNARNCGIGQARGAILAFIDDDTRPRRDWLAAIWRAYQRDPTIECVGGRIEPCWPREPPPWLTSAHWGPLALQTARGDTPYLDRDHASSCLVTANFACRALTLKRIGGFSPRYLRDEDRELNLRLWRAGARGKYDDSIVVVADIQPERLTKRYHRRWHYVTGCNHARMRYRELIDRDGRLRTELLGTGRRLLGAPGFLYRELAGHLIDWSAHVVRGDMDRAFFPECRIRYLTAYLTTRHLAYIHERVERIRLVSYRRRRTA